MTVAVNFAARTDVGLVRSRNEDSGYAGPHLLAVADGMGGHAGGNVASSLVLAGLAPLDGDSHGADDALELLADVLAAANTSIATIMAEHAELHGMGTTLTALMRCGVNGLALVHIGDSRAFLLREGTFAQITKDHSYVQSLVDSGRVTREEAEHHPQRSLVTRVLTGTPGDEPDLAMRVARQGDRYLICSDGLSDYVAADTIADVVTGGCGPDQTARKLVALALRAGAPDNVTVVVADIVSPTTNPSSQPLVVGAAAENSESPAGAVAVSPAAKAAALRREVLGAPPMGEPEALEGERTGRRGRIVRTVLVTFIVALALAGALFAGYRWTQTQLYVAEDNGRVAIYQGVPQTLGPIALSSLQQTTDVDVTNLPDFYRQRLEETIPAGNDAEAHLRVNELRAQAAACAARRVHGIPCGSGSG